MEGLLRHWQVISYMVTLVTIYVPIWLFVRRMPLRSALGIRVAELAVIHIVVAVALYVNIDTISMKAASAEVWDSAPPILTLLIIFSLIPILVIFIYDCSIWDAMFCAAAGYTTQNLASSVIELLRTLANRGTDLGDKPVETLIDLLIYAVVYLICYRLFIDRASRTGLGHGSKRYVVPMLAVMLVVIFFDTRVKALAVSSAALALAFDLRVVHIATCAFMLYAEYQIVYVERLASDVAAERELRAEEERMWQLSQSNVEAINARVHDMRHTVARTLTGSGAGIDSKTLAEVVREIRVYDTSVRTGNSALDTVLSEKGLVCERNGVQLAVIADGTVLGSLAPADLFSLVGGLIDQVSEVAAAYPDPERRCISFSMREVAGMAGLHLDCPVAGKAELDLKPVMMVVERCGGTLTSSCEDGVLAVDVLLPR